MMLVPNPDTHDVEVACCSAPTAVIVAATSAAAREEHGPFSGLPLQSLRFDQDQSLTTGLR
jgi:hypothetical protein